MKSLWFVFAVLCIARAAIFKGISENFPVNEENSLKVRDALLSVITSNSAAFSFYQQLMEYDNIVFSPLSISNALAMLFLGMGNSTSEELEDILGYNSSFLHKGLRSVRESAMDDITDCSVHSLKFANALVYCNNFSITSSYRNDIVEYYTAEFLEYDPTAEPGSIIALVNSWVDNATDGKIKTIMTSLASQCSMSVINALYFKAPWKFPFDPKKTVKKTFYNFGYKPSEVLMMHRTVRALYGYYPSIDSFILELPYSGLDVDVMFFLPRQRSGMYKLETSINIEVYNTLHQTMYNTEVEISIPKFRLEDTIELGEVLKSLGIKELFLKTADFSGICKDENLYLSQIIHATTLDVTESGTEAASSTKATIQTLSLKPTFHLNHPFMFIFKHRWTSAMLFIGKVQML